MIFDLEDEGSDGASPNEPPVLRFVDNSLTHPRHGRQRSGAHTGRPFHFSSLWPTSYPTQGPRARVSSEANKPSMYANGDSVGQTAPPNPPGEQEVDSVDEKDEEILKLVAAHTPSHRSAWKRNGRGWKTFLSRHHVRGASGGLIDENQDDSERTPNDTDESDWDVMHGMSPGFLHARHAVSRPAGFPASLPITIGPLLHRREPLSLASYQPNTSSQERASVLRVDGRPISSASLRRASYAERDQTRHLDPGALDFTTEIEDEEESDSDRPNVADETRSRHRALKILEARSKIPAAGMWRSLA